MYSEIGPRLPHNLKISSQGETVRIRYLIVFHAGLLICLHPWYANAITLEEVMTMASEQHPKLRIAEKSVDAAKGNLEEQGSYAYNPELSLEPQRRRLNAGGTSNDYYITLSQGIEIGGKRGYRELSAQAALSAANQLAEATRQRLSIGAARAF
ncbi:MAG: TolC family protein, partial [Mariprofundus sp.]